MKTLFLAIFSFTCFYTFGQVNLIQPFKDCNVNGSITIYDYTKQKWYISDTIDANKETLPASTFKIINLLIALETKIISNENDVIKWTGETDTTLYGYRPNIYRDMTVKEAFELSAGWVFIELAKKIGKDKYLDYLRKCHYGNLNLSESGVDFWNFGPFAISPKKQVEFLIKIYKNQTPFSKKNIDILKRVMISENSKEETIRSKTGWTRLDGNDMGWWVGYVTSENNVYFFATRIFKKRSEINSNFADCRKEITKSILKHIIYE